MGDVSRAKVATVENYFELFNGILNSKQLEGRRLLVRPFPRQQLNLSFQEKISWSSCEPFDHHDKRCA
ncbi:MAG: hypothetical protein WBG50_01715 [Desulfomonilaceae bacterium]